MAPLVFWLDLFGVCVFAASGALVASRKQLDLVGFVLIATVTGIGGGTLRDLLLGRAPVFWVGEPLHLWLTTATALLVFVTAHHLESRFKALLWADAVGLAIFAVIGAEIALAAGVPWSVAALMGVMTATFGGLIRDVLCNELPLLLRKEIYATAAVAGAAVDIALRAAGAAGDVAIGLGFATAFLARGAGILFGLSLPVYRPRPGRDWPDR